MNEEMRARIEKLKDQKQAVPLWMRTKEEQEIITRARPEDRLVTHYESWPNWQTSISTKPHRDSVYILKPGYEPEPEYDEIEIVRGDSDLWLVLIKDMPGRSCRCLYDCGIHPAFVCFHYMDGAETTIPGNVPNWLRQNPGQIMYARFVRSEP